MVDRGRLAGLAIGVVGAAAVAAIATSHRSSALVPEDMRGALPAPGADDRDESCADVASNRACWGEAAGTRPRLARRSLPEGVLPDAGWRCDGTGRARVCEDRARNAGPWDCSTSRCIQPAPRMPDDGEWDCVEMTGVVFCRSLSEAAGVAKSTPDLGWACGRRPGAAAERICVDLSPDRPDSGEGWTCRFVYSGSERGHVCVRSDAILVGGACSDDRRCPAPASCVDGRCLPPRPSPSCWLDPDCGPGAQCRWGSCVERGS